MANLTIIRLGNPILRNKAKTISPVEMYNQNIQHLIEDMVETMHKNNGVGLAAPQVGISKRIIVIDVQEHSKFPGHEVVPVTPMLNPVIEPASDEKFELWEGCLSIPDLQGSVKRFNDIQVTYFDREGKKIIRKFSGFPAAVIQHECDHLDGIVYLDRMKDLKSLTFNEEYEKFIEKKEKAK